MAKVEAEFFFKSELKATIKKKPQIIIHHQIYVFNVKHQLRCTLSRTHR